MERLLMDQDPQKVAQGLESARVAAARQLLAGVERGVFPGASAAIGWCGQRVLAQAGALTYDAESPPVGPQTIYDCASLTKAVATMTMAMMLLDRGLDHPGFFGLDDSVARYLPKFLDVAEWDVQAAARKKVTVRHLLAHTSGLPAYEKFYLRAREPAHVLDEALTMELEAPPGQRTLYSDVGFILLGALLEHTASCALAAETLDAFCSEEVFLPLGMATSLFNPSESRRQTIAPTELDNTFRQRLVHGEVHDENAWVMGGVAGHAGLFSTAPDLAVFCQFMLNEGNWCGRQLIRPETIREFTRSHPALHGAPWGLGWDKPSAPSSSGHYFSPASFGHLGFTGTSIWIDPEKKLYVVLLTNRVHPSRANEAIRTFRPTFHDAVVNALGIPN